MFFFFFFIINHIPHLAMFFMDSINKQYRQYVQIGKTYTIDIIYNLLYVTTHIDLL